MKRPTVLRYLRFALFLTGMFCLFVAGNDRSPAQDIREETCFDLGGGCDVEAVAAIADSTDGVEIDAYADEEIVSFDLLDFGDLAVLEGGLFEGDSLIDQNEGDDDGTGFAEVDLSDPVNLGNVYTMEGDFFIDDPEAGLVSLGSLFAQVVAAAPEIDDISPPGDESGASGQLTVNGADLFDQFNGEVGVSPIPGVHWGSSFQGSADGSQIILTYTIDNNAKSGDQEFSLETRFGQSNTVTFTIFDPPPVVTSVTPDVWQAGSQTSITVGGQHFGPCAKISVSGPGVTGSSTNGPSTDTQVQGTVTIDINSPGGQATVTVTSDGEACNGFLGHPGQTGSANDTATIKPADASPIVIINVNDPQTSSCQGTDLSQKMQTIYAGGPVELKACLPGLLPGQTVETATWTINGNVVSHYFPNSPNTSLTTFKPPGDCVDQINGASEDPGCTTGIFNWICPIANADVCSYPGTVTAEFAYTFNSGNGASQTVTYNVLGPGNTGTPITVNPDGGTATEQVTLEDLGEGPMLAVGPTGITVVSSDGSNGQSVGLVLMASAQLPTDPNTGETVGEFEWARVLNNPSTISFVQGSTPDSQLVPDQGAGAFQCSLVNPRDLNPEVVTAPATSVAQKNVPNDLLLVTGGVGLQPHEGAGAFDRLETAYLFWIPPDLPSNCFVCKSAIPLGAVTYHYSSATTNTLDPKQGTQGWTINAGCGTVLGGFKLVPGRGGSEPTAFPTWKAKFEVQNCSSLH